MCETIGGLEVGDYKEEYLTIRNVKEETES